MHPCYLSCSSRAGVCQDMCIHSILYTTLDLSIFTLPDVHIHSIMFGGRRPFPSACRMLLNCKSWTSIPWSVWKAKLVNIDEVMSSCSTWPLRENGRRVGLQPALCMFITQLLLCSWKSRWTQSPHLTVYLTYSLPVLLGKSRLKTPLTTS